MRKSVWTLSTLMAGLTAAVIALPPAAEAKAKGKEKPVEMAMGKKPEAAKAKEAVYMWPVAKDQICMVQKYDMEAKTTPVPLDGKTYWVCCEGCKNTITKDKSERFAKDPVSGKTVNKADAVVGRASNGQVHFFENEKNLAAFRPTFTPVPSKD